MQGRAQQGCWALGWACGALGPRLGVRGAQEGAQVGVRGTRHAGARRSRRTGSSTAARGVARVLGVRPGRAAGQQVVHSVHSAYF